MARRWLCVRIAAQLSASARPFPLPESAQSFRPVCEPRWPAGSGGPVRVPVRGGLLRPGARPPAPCGWAAQTCPSQFAREHLVEHNAERIDVHSVVHLARRFGLLRRHVLRRAHYAWTGERNVASLASGSALARGRGNRIRCRHADQLCQTEVCYLHLPGTIEQDVLRLDITVDNAPVMRILEGFAYLRHDGQCFLGADRAASRSCRRLSPSTYSMMKK